MSPSCNGVTGRRMSGGGREEGKGRVHAGPLMPQEYCSREVSCGHKSFGQTQLGSPAGEGRGWKSEAEANSQESHTNAYKLRNDTFDSMIQRRFLMLLDDDTFAFE